MAPKRKSSKKPIAKLSDSSKGSVKQLWIPVAGVIGAITLINQLVEIWNGNPTRTNYIIASVLLGIWLIALITWAFGKTIWEQKGFFSNRTRLRNKNVPTYKLISGTVLLISIIGIIGGAVILTKQKNEFAKRQDEKIIILIANFDDGNNGRDLLDIRNSIVDQLKTNLANYEDTEIIALDEIVSTTQGSSYARDVLGKKYQADIVIWGRYRADIEDSITINFENISPTTFDVAGESKTYKPKIAIADLKTSNLRQRLGVSTSALVNYISGLIQYNAGDYATALTRFEQTLNELNSEDEIVSKSEVLFLIGNSYSELGQSDEAIDNLNLAIELSPQFKLAYNSRGVVYVNNLQEFDNSIADFTQVIKLDPQFELAYYNRGVAYYYLKQHDKAIMDFTQALQLDPQFTEAYNNRGVAYTETQQYDKAIQDFTKALELDSQLSESYNGLGIVYRNLQQYDKAIEYYSIAILIAPEYPDSYYNRAIVYDLLKQYDKAMTDYNSAIQVDPTFQFAYVNRVNLYRYLKQHEKALADHYRAIELDPQDAIAYHDRCLVYYDTKQYDKALIDCSQAIQLDPQFADAYRTRGVLYHILGRDAEAELDINNYEELIQAP